jgi:hypothetical protein
MDEDEAEIYQKRMKKMLTDLKIRDLSIVQVQGVMGDGPEVKIYA